MTKLSKVQSKALLTIAQNELNELNGKRLSSYYGNKATYQALNKRGLIQVTKTSVRDGSYEAMLLTDAGRTVAIDLLHEGAADEMADELHYRDMEVKRKQAGQEIAAKIIERYDVGMVEVIADYRLRDNMTLCYAVGFPQELDHRYASPLVRIDWSRDEYTIGTTGTHLIAKDAKRMAELMLIAVQIIESGILS